jgi:translation initiation factor IF-1
MVKNQTGGNKAKQQGRKFREQQVVTNVRRVKEVGEMYAAVTRMYGGKYCQVMCQDGTLRRCTIRKKFTQRRGQNLLSNGVWILVGIYDFNTVNATSATCDLLEVYSAGEKDRLKQIEKSVNFTHLNQVSDASKEVAFSSLSTGEREPAHSDVSGSVSEEDEDDDDAVFADDDADLAQSATAQSVAAAPAPAAALRTAMDWIDVDDI